MLRAILFGPSSLTNSKAPLPITHGCEWGVDCVTPGAIACVAVLVGHLIIIIIEFHITVFVGHISALRGQNLGFCRKRIKHSISRTFRRL